MIPQHAAADQGIVVEPRGGGGNPGGEAKYSQDAVGPVPGHQIEFGLHAGLNAVHTPEPLPAGNRSVVGLLNVRKNGVVHIQPVEKGRVFFRNGDEHPVSASGQFGCHGQAFRNMGKRVVSRDQQELHHSGARYQIGHGFRIYSTIQRPGIMDRLRARARIISAIIHPGFRPSSPNLTRIRVLIREFILARALAADGKDLNFYTG